MSPNDLATSPHYQQQQSQSSSAASATTTSSTTTPSPQSTSTSTTPNHSSHYHNDYNTAAVTQQQQSSSPINDVPSLTATTDMCVVCFDVLLLKLHERHVRGGVHGKTNASHYLFPSTAVAIHHNNNNNNNAPSCPLFVTWECWNSRYSRYELRGCIGSLRPIVLSQTRRWDGVAQYALRAALQDRRFTAMTPPEINTGLRVKVSLLVNYEPCRDVYDWTIGKHGIMIAFECADETTAAHAASAPLRRYNATYLPEVALEQGWDHATAVASLIQKAGYPGRLTPQLLASITCTRYQSSKCSFTFHEYLQYRQEAQVQQQAQQQQQQQQQAAAASLNETTKGAAAAASRHPPPTMNPADATTAQALLEMIALVTSNNNNNHNNTNNGGGAWKHANNNKDKNNCNVM